MHHTKNDVFTPKCSMSLWTLRDENCWSNPKKCRKPSRNKTKDFSTTLSWKWLCQKTKRSTIAIIFVLTYHVCKIENAAFFRLYIYIYSFVFWEHYDARDASACKPTLIGKDSCSRKLNLKQVQVQNIKSSALKGHSTGKAEDCKQSGHLHQSARQMTFIAQADTIHANYSSALRSVVADEKCTK